ncbi:VOC family protein, partial [Amycolatopsis circi]|uniref:VOC family protein n=1 Tax=Amycolatopsis circi TaxID=871959 RepID=UPI0013BE90D8
MAFTIDLTLDCTNAQLLAEFWKTALGYIDEPPPPPFTTREEWLAQFDLPEDESAEDGAWLCHPAGAGPRLAILKVPEPKTVKNRLHIDIRVPRDADPAQRWATVKGEAERLAAAGGTILVEHDGHHVTMADPEGNEFCVAPTPAGFARVSYQHLRAHEPEAELICRPLLKKKKQHN